ncbi:uncharacterized protein LOC142582201 [Dermacentor variabilis]|uniref:uncharacterized protein LOC142582201 n=1 Tax=Dermacentor variabilis TaxID=34621 RepID=UPI003F5C0727
MCSLRAVSAASGRGSTVSAEDYKVILPQLPTGNASLNTVFLHCDVSARPYRINDFEEEIERLQVVKDVASIGAYQMNHVWALTTHSMAAKQVLVDAKELRIKGKRCLVIDPNDSQVRVKLHWLPYHISDDAVRKALEPYGKIEEMSRETWQTGKFKGAQTSSRSVILRLKHGFTVESLPHQIRIQGSNTLVIVPGRPPLCLRCKKSGHIRKDCRIPRCSACRKFGHEADDCRKTYATMTREDGENADTDALMDEDEAVETLQPRTINLSSWVPEPATPTTQKEAEADSPVKAVSPVVSVTTDKTSGEPEEKCSVVFQVPCPSVPVESPTASKVSYPAEPERPETPVASDDAISATEAEIADLGAERPKTPAASEAPYLPMEAETPEAYHSLESEPEDASYRATRMPEPGSDEDEGTSGSITEMRSMVQKVKSKAAMKRNRVTTAPRIPPVEKRHKRSL